MPKMAVVLGLLGLGLTGCAPLVQSDAVTADALIGGIASDLRPASVSLGGCTGVLIAPDLVLTAAHCVVLEGYSHPPAGVVAPESGTRFPAAAHYVHPGFQRCRPAGEHYAGTAGVDLAVVKLEHALDGVPVAALVPVGVRPSAPIGSDLDFVGFGTPSTQRRYGGFSLDAQSDEGVVTATGAEVGICPGDSGGALYVGRAADLDDVGEVLGITASQPFGTTAYGNCRKGNTTLFADLSMPANRDFVDRVTAGVEPAYSDAEMPECCGPGDVRSCEPGGTQRCGDSGEWSSCDPLQGGVSDPGAAL